MIDKSLSWTLRSDQFTSGALMEPSCQRQDAEMRSWLRLSKWDAAVINGRQATLLHSKSAAACIMHRLNRIQRRC